MRLKNVLKELLIYLSRVRVPEGARKYWFCGIAAGPVLFSLAGCLPGLIRIESGRHIRMKVTVAIDSLKGSLSSVEAGQAAAEGVKRVYPDAEVCVRPLADGGEGTVEALTCGLGGTLQCVKVTGPLGDPVECRYGIVTEAPGDAGDPGRAENLGSAEGSAGPAGRTAVIEMSGAAGLTQVPDELRNPLNTTTYGVGEVIRDAIEKGCRRFIVGIGGSATNDGGIGMLQALGFDILDKDGNPVSRCGRGLRDVARITGGHVIPELKECTFRIACDVTNPLCGEKGCSVVYGPQKGATPEIVRDMDRWLAKYAEAAAVYCAMEAGVDAENPGMKTAGPDAEGPEMAGGAASGRRAARADMECPGTGAAGGLGFAFLTFTNAILESGVKIVLEETRLEDYVADADIVITGEGRLDGQTVMGKAPIGAARLAKKYGKPVLGFCGSAAKDAAACNDGGIDAFFPILRSVVTLRDAMDRTNAAGNMADAVEQAFRLVRMFSAIR